MNQMFGVGARGSRLHTFNALAGEGHKQQAARRCFIYAPRLQVEKSILFNLVAPWVHFTSSA
jgi:hypothetical protein